MRITTVLALSAALAAFQPSVSFAMSTMSPNTTMKMAKCPANDPAVIMNTTKHTYMLDTTKNRDAMKGMMSHDKFICKSQAEKMGAKMITAPPKSDKM